MDKRNLLGLAWPALTDFFAHLGEPAYRARQVMEWIYVHNEGDFARMNNLPRALREKLREEARVGTGEVVSKQQAPDGTLKLAMAFPGKGIVECVILRYHHGLTLCLSSQVGCKMGCAFCASGQGEFGGNLTAAEILEQIWQANQELKAKSERIGRLVYMGMGEPLDNYQQVLESIRFANNPAAFHIGMRNITLSTCGVVPGIQKLAKEGLQLTLSISLHAPLDYLRDQIMPINRRYPLAELLAACREYSEASGRRITFEYLLLADFNDQVVHAEKLVSLLSGMNANVNVIPYNPVPGLPWIAPGRDKVQRFLRILNTGKIQATVRRELGPEIDAACGQLRNRLRGEE